MSAFDAFPLGQPGFVNNILDRAAHLRNKDDKLMALEGDSRSRAYVVHRDSLIVAKDGDDTRALLTIEEALKAGANPGTIFLGLRDGAAIFGMGISQPAAEKLVGRNDVAVSDLRGMATQGIVPPGELSAIAMAKSMVTWHQRHGFCANCGRKSLVSVSGFRRDCPECKAQHFPRTDPVAIMLPLRGDYCLLGRSARFQSRVYSALAGFIEHGETIEAAVRREIKEESGIVCGKVTYLASQPWPFPMSLMIGCHAQALSEEIVIDPEEIEDARWFSRAEASSMLAGQHPQELLCPPPIAIAHWLIRAFIEQG